jgi:hypothetical protein
MDYEMKRALHLINGGEPADFLSIVPQNSVIKPGKDPELIRRVLGFDVSAKKLLAEAAPGFVKPILGFIMNTKDKTASLPGGWSRTFMSEIDEVLDGPQAVNPKCVQKLGGKAIRVVTLFRAVRGFCNGIFLAVRHHKQGSAQAQRARISGINPRYITPFVDDLRLLRSYYFWLLRASLC